MPYFPRDQLHRRWIVVSALLAAVIVVAIVVSLHKVAPCWLQEILGWERYSNEQEGFSIQYPGHGYFQHVTLFPNGQGIYFDTQPDQVPYHDVVGATISFGFPRQLFTVTDSDELKSLKNAAQYDSRYDFDVSITSSIVCRKQVVRLTSRRKIGTERFEKTSSVYFAHKNRIFRAWLTNGSNYVGTAKEKEYTNLFEQMVHTVKFLPNQSR